MKRLFFALLIVVSCAVQAQETDSLENIRPRLDYRMFAPLTFYHGIVNDAFSINANPSQYNNTLLQQYLNHPDWVINSQKNIDKAAAIGEELPTPIVTDAHLVEKAPLLPEMTDVIPMEVKVIKPRFWNYKGDYSLQFMQSYVSGNWYKGGESNYSMLGSVTMEANYNNKQKVKWDNKLEMKLGLQNLRSDSVHSVKSTEDLVRFTSKFGLQATKKWYYTVQLLAQSQFTHSYKTNDPVVYSDFLAPLKVNLSVGMDYNVDWLKHRLKGTVHLAPAAYNMQYTRIMELSERLGLEGKRVLHDYGSQFTVDLTWELSELIRWKTRMYGFTSYKRTEFEWENTIVFQLNKWLAAQLFIYPRFDDAVGRDDHHGYWQYQEFSSIGFTYKF